jgi:hydrogenase expression/formation protein HypE
VANEGRFLAFVPAAQADFALSVLAREASDCTPAIIGRVTGSGDPRVVLKSILGPNRVLDMLSGEQLPRIC